MGFLLNWTIIDRGADVYIGIFLAFVCASFLFALPDDERTWKLRHKIVACFIMLGVFFGSATALKNIFWLR